MSLPISQDKSVAKPGSGSKAWSSSWPAVATLVGITLAFYHRLWLPGLVLTKSDAFAFYLVIKQHLIERLSTGELPQWFPYEGLGRSFIGTTITGIFHPFTTLYFLLQVADAYRASTLLSCVLAAFGAFALGRTLNVSRAGSLLAGIGFTLSGYVVSLTCHLAFLYSICVLPLFCATLELSIRENRAWAVASAVTWATVFLNGDIQTGYYYIFIGLLWATARAPESYREAWLRLGLTGVLAALLAGVQLGPAWLVFVSSERADPALFFQQALEWSTHPLRLISILASPVGEHVDPVVLARVFFKTPQAGFVAESLYLGIPLTGLAILGIGHRRDLRVLAVLGIFAFLLSLGPWGGIYEIFYHVVPLWSAFRAPERLMGVFAFATAMLAGAGLDALRTGVGGPWPWFTVAVLCGTAGLGLQTEAAVTWAATSFGASADLARELANSAATAFFFSVIAALGVGIVAAGIKKQALRSELLLAVLAGIVALDLSRANLGAYHTGPVEAATFIPPLAEALQAREGPLKPGRFRVFTIQRNTFTPPWHVRSVMGPYGASSVLRRQALDLEHNAEFNIEAVKPYLPAHSSKLAAMLMATIAQRVGAEVAARFNVTYSIGRGAHLEDPRYAQGVVAVLPEYDLVLFKNPVPAKPRAYLSLKPERVDSPVDPAKLIARPDFLSGEVDVIETTDATLPGPALSGSAVIEHYTPEAVRVRVETTLPAVLILLDAFDKGWTATLETGAELPILRADTLVRAVVVPAGTHRITFRYETPLLRIGALASLAGCLIGIGFVVHERWWRHPNRVS